MSPLLLLIVAGVAGLGLLVVGLARPGRRAAPPPVPSAGDASFAAETRSRTSAGAASLRVQAPASAPERQPGLLGLFEARDEHMLQSLRLVGMTVAEFSRQRLLGTLGGLAAGIVLSLLMGRGPIGTVLLAVLATAAGWLLPMLSVRDTARKMRAEIDQIVRMWVVLVAQQVSAGVEPATAMLHAAQSGTRPGWRLLHRFLLSAQQQRRGTWEGLRDLVDRYGIRSLEVIVASLGLAAGRGTRLSDAILGSGESLWKDHMAKEREAANRRSQVVVVPATGVALALAGILVYPPFTSLSGGGIAGLG
ncbi:MAG: hypothetical protein OXG52_12120 [bacterium]|nr:hypothetical protein [bacterium]